MTTKVDKKPTVKPTRVAAVLSDAFTQVARAKAAGFSVNAPIVMKAGDVQLLAIMARKLIKQSKARKLRK